ncbi:unnamed protein product [Ophioblennius macclurei]
MSVAHLAFAFLLLFQGLLQAVRGELQPCPAPRLNDGFLDRQKDSYANGDVVTYTCDNGYKPTVEGWWATCTCQNGKWTHVPQCIDEKACIPTTVPNGNFPVNKNGWYEEGQGVSITCDDGYEITSQNSEARCSKGEWSSLPVCGKSPYSCDGPPKVEHAVVINLEHKEVFAENAAVQYECEDGYHIQERVTKKPIVCTSGTWTEGPTCTLRNTPRQDGSASSAGRGSDANSGSSGGAGPMTVRVKACGSNFPVVPNAVLVEDTEMYLKYQCSNFYKLVGLDTVVCYHDGTWSPLPECQVDSCGLDTAAYHALQNSGTRFIKKGESINVPCKERGKTADVWCIDNELRFSRCCSSNDRYWGYC